MSRRRRSGAYFKKINCFCFTEQTLRPARSARCRSCSTSIPRSPKDAEQDDLNTITLSYTFYPVREPARPVAEAPTSKTGRRQTERRASALPLTRTETMTMADAHAKHHDYHLVDPSPWPVVGSISAFVLAVGADHLDAPDVCRRAAGVRAPARSACSTR